MSEEPKTRPSNFVVFVFIVVGVVVVWFAWATAHHVHRSADQKILIQKSKQH